MQTNFAFVMTNQSHQIMLTTWAWVLCVRFSISKSNSHLRLVTFILLNEETIKGAPMFCCDNTLIKLRGSKGLLGHSQCISAA